MQHVLHRAGTRGHANLGWLDTYHTFSFADYHDPDRVHFGALRVLNDDTISPGMGFGMHPHENMEIITIPLSGELAHRDSMGNSAVIKAGEVQVMSAGTGVLHSEFNNRSDRKVSLLQIWVYPDRKNVAPRYDQKKLLDFSKKNEWQRILSPIPEDPGVWIYQDAWFHLGSFDAGHVAEYRLHKPGNGVYFFVIRGGIEIDGRELSDRDGIGIWDAETIEARADSSAEVLVMEVPMGI